MPELVFYLPARPGGGGSNSVVQEFLTLVSHYSLGHLVVRHDYLADFIDQYDIDREAQRRIHTDLKKAPQDALLVATTNDSVSTVLEHAKKSNGSVTYYVQDYEPLFYPAQSTEFSRALLSYQSANAVTAVVKSEWLRSILMSETFLPVLKIRPSINRELFFPEFFPRNFRRLAAMVRPSTSRRGPKRTVALLNRLAEQTGDELRIEVFGTDRSDLLYEGLRLHSRIGISGRLPPKDVAKIIRGSDFVLDASDYQAFGRTVAEAMACGAIPIVTKFGAPPEFVHHRMNGWLFDPREWDEAYAVLEDAVRVEDSRLQAMRVDAMDAVSGWSESATASDWFAILRDLQHSM